MTLRLLIPGGIPSHKSNGGSLGSLGSTTKAKKYGRPYRCSIVERPPDVRPLRYPGYWDRYDNSGSRQTDRLTDRGRVICQSWYIRYDVYTQCMFIPYIICTSNRICIVLQKTYIFGTCFNVYTVLLLKPHIFNIYGNI